MVCHKSKGQHHLISMIHFQPNCTLPPGVPGFVTAPNVRSTMNIVWSCISTILLCCWSIQHLNIPPQFQPKTTRQKLMRKLFFFKRKVKWMMMTLFAPEALLANAVSDLHSCLLHSPVLKELAEEDGVPWSKTHTFLADMGGFAIRFVPSGQSIDRQYPSTLSANFSSDARPPRQSGHAGTTRDRQRGDKAPEEDQSQVCAQESGRSLSNQLWPRNPPNQERLSRIETCDSPKVVNRDRPPTGGLATNDQDVVTQRGVVDVVSPDIDVPRRHLGQSAAEQHNHDAATPAATSEEPARKHLQLVTPSKAAVKARRNTRTWRESRSTFRARVEKASQSFGDIAWRVSRHNENIAEVVWVSLPASVKGRGSTQTTLQTFEGDVWVLTAAQLVEARRRKLISRLPHLTEDEVSDRNKGDLLVKILALLQVSWMLIQILARARQHISSTPLEIMSLSFAACAFVTYTLLLNHPQDVTTSIYIDASRLSTVDDMRIIANLSPTYYWFVSNRLPSLPNNTIHRGKSGAFFHIGLGTGAAVFGGAHLVAWNFVFPTALERILWRTSSLITMLSPLVVLVVTWQGNVLTHLFRGRSVAISRDRWLRAFVGLNMLILVLARLFIIVEAFRSLYYLPQDAYFATWAANAPYIA